MLTFAVEKAREFHTHTKIYFCFIDYYSFDCVDHNKLEKFLQR